MATTATRVLDEARFESRARIGDILAIGLVVVAGAALLFNMYTLGYTAGEVARGTGDVFARDKRFVLAIVEAAIVVAGFGWVVYRVLSNSVRRVGG